MPPALRWRRCVWPAVPPEGGEAAAPMPGEGLLPPPIGIGIAVLAEGFIIIGCAGDVARGGAAPAAADGIPIIAFGPPVFCTPVYGDCERDAAAAPPTGDGPRGGDTADPGRPPAIIPIELAEFKPVAGLPVRGGDLADADIMAGPFAAIICGPGGIFVPGAIIIFLPFTIAKAGACAPPIDFIEAL